MLRPINGWPTLPHVVPRWVWLSVFGGQGVSAKMRRPAGVETAFARSTAMAAEIQSDDGQGWSWTAQASSVATPSAVRASSIVSSLAVVCPSPAVSSSSRVKRRRSRSWASGAGLQLIPTTRSSPGALSPIFDCARLLASFKSMLSSHSPALDPADAGRTRKANAGAATSVASGGAERYPPEGATWV